MNGLGEELTPKLDSGMLTIDLSEMPKYLALGDARLEEGSTLSAPSGMLEAGFSLLYTHS